jgi:hypothetical protein
MRSSKNNVIDARCRKELLSAARPKSTTASRLSSLINGAATRRRGSEYQELDVDYQRPLFPERPELVPPSYAVVGVLGGPDRTGACPY